MQTRTIGDLSLEGPYTLFAPTNAAFEAASLAPSDISSAQIFAHVSNKEISSASVSSGVVKYAFSATYGAPFKFTVEDSGIIAANNATVLVADIPASNGVIHIIDAVLSSCKPLSEVAAENGLTAYLSAIEANPSFLDLISEAGPPKTLFVPTNDAFAAVPGLADLDQDLLLEKHTVGNKLKYQNLLITADTRINTLADEFLTVDGRTGDVLVTPTVAGGPSTVITAELAPFAGHYLEDVGLFTCADVIHVVDKVFALDAQVPPPSPPPP